MVLSDLQKGLSNFAEELSSQTYLNTFRTQRRDSLLAEGLGTRANSIWKMAQYIIATYDNNENEPLESYLKGWKTLVKNYKNQFLIIAVDNNGNWEMYDSYAKLLGGNEYIQDFFAKRKRATQKKNTIQTIYYGAPGTGKSHKVREIIGEETNQPNVFRTTFHPDTDYASFVGCYKPSMRPTTSAEKTLTGKDEEIAYSFVPQVFTDAYVYAYKHPAETTYLVLEEINRGNCAQIFGDLFQLLDRKDGVSEYKIKADNDLAKYLVAQLGEESEGIKDGKLCLPANLSILATMNTSDQSLFPMDSAFKRRWEWEYVPINYSADILSGSFDITIGEKVYSWVEFIQSVNKHIFDLTQSEDKQMGNFFIKHSVDESEFKSKVMFYLWYEVLRDETGNNKYFFRQNTPDGKDSTPFTFKDLYEKDAQETIQLFMAYLGVAPK